MRINAMTKAALTAVAVLAAAPMAVAPVATAAYPIVGKLGSTLQTTDTVGQVTYSWRVSGLQPSSDPTPGFPVAARSGRRRRR